MNTSPLAVHATLTSHESQTFCQDGFIFIILAKFLPRAFHPHFSPVVLIYQSVEFPPNVSILYFLLRSLEQLIWIVDRGQTYWSLSLTEYCNFYQVNVGFPQYNLPSARQVWSYHNILSQPGHKHNGRKTRGGKPE